VPSEMCVQCQTKAILLTIRTR